MALLVADPHPANFTAYTDKFQSYGQPHFWLYRVYQEHNHFIWHNFWNQNIFSFGLLVLILSKFGQSQGMLYKQLCHLINSVGLGL